MSGYFLILFFLWPAVVLKLPQGDIVTVHVNESIVREGKSNMMLISVEVKEGYHVQANRVNDDSLIPTTLELNDDEGIVVSRKKFPAGKKFRLEGTDTFLKVYDGKFPIKLFLEPGAKARSGRYTLAAKLQYQACDSRRCFFPRVIDFPIPVEIKLKGK
jgi:hypothetical protein